MTDEDAAWLAKFPLTNEELNCLLGMELGKRRIIRRISDHHWFVEKGSKSRRISEPFALRLFHKKMIYQPVYNHIFRISNDGKMALEAHRTIGGRQQLWDRWRDVFAKRAK